MPAILFGSISSVADTSELQRHAFNNAFAEHGLDWRWDREDYRAMLDASGGANRIAEFASSRDEEVDAKAVHETKSRLFQQLLGTTGAAPREGVLETIQAAKDKGWKLGLVTTTSRENITALLSAVPDLSESDFDVIVDSSSVEQPKPHRASYAYALKELGVGADECVAIEDNVEGVQAANAAGVTCVATPNENTAGHDFAAAEQTVDRLEPDAVTKLVNAA